MDTRTIEARTHGRYLVKVPPGPGPWPLLIGFHGYKENGATHLAALASIPGSDRWLQVAVQGLHRFYSKGGGVVASWMTSEDRELAIADNIAYVRGVVDAVGREFPTRRPLVFFGFSQGVAMAFRAAAHIPADLLVVTGADVPPDVAAGPAVPLPRVVYARGSRDDFYTAAHHAGDLAVLERLGARVETVAFDGGHELTSEFMAATGRTLSAIEGSRQGAERQPRASD